MKLFKPNYSSFCHGLGVLLWLFPVLFCKFTLMCHVLYCTSYHCVSPAFVIALVSSTCPGLATCVYLVHVYFLFQVSVCLRLLLVFHLYSCLCSLYFTGFYLPQSASPVLLSARFLLPGFSFVIKARFFIFFFNLPAVLHLLPLAKSSPPDLMMD